MIKKGFMSKVKDKIRKEGKDRKKDVVGLQGIFSLLPCSFLLDVMTSLLFVELMVLVSPGLVLDLT